MCLTTTMKTPFTAKKDFVVYKGLVKEPHDGYVTSIRSYPVNFNSEMRPDTEFPETVEMNTKLIANIEGGAIHAYTDSVAQYNIERLFKAIVKKGTRFYVSTDGTEIAAESLYITDEEITENNPCTEEFKDTYEYIMSELREAAEQHNGVRVGDIMLSDKTYVHAEGYKDDGSMKAIGVVGYFIDEKPIAVGLKTKKLQWHKHEGGIKAITVGNTEKEVYADYNGQEHTDRLYAAYKNCIKVFPSLKYCVEYETEGTKKGDWYFPSSGEVANIARNIVLINDSLVRIDGAELIDCCRLWSSTEYSESNSWACYTDSSYLNYWANKWYWDYVRPAFALHLSA